MRFNEVLHPEIVLDKRGHELVRAFYRETLEIIHVKENYISFNTKNFRTRLQAENAQHMAEDNILAQHMSMCKLYALNPGPVYRLGKDIALALSEMDRDLPLNILPERFFGHFSLPKGTIADDTGGVIGGYVYIGPTHNSPIPIRNLTEEDLKIERALWITYVCETGIHEVEGLGPIAALLLPLCSTKLDELFKCRDAVDQDFNMDNLKVQDTKEERAKLREPVFRMFLNAVIYLFSESAQLELARPFPQQPLSKKELTRRGKVINECSVPVTFVYRNYHRQHYSVDSTLVKTHPRWQPCGPKRQQVKLIWVKEHERHYGRE